MYIPNATITLSKLLHINSHTYTHTEKHTHMLLFQFISKGNLVVKFTKTHVAGNISESFSSHAEVYVYLS